MNPKDTPYHHGDLRAELERIATEAVQQSGADALSLRACARAAGVDPAAVYRHFKSKDDILCALSRQAFTDLANQMEASNSPGDPPQDALLGIGRAYVVYATANPHLFAMMFDLAGRLPMQDVAGLSDTGRNAYQILLEAWCALHPSRADEASRFAFALWSAVHGASHLLNAHLGPDQGPERDSTIAFLTETILRGCTAMAQRDSVE